MRLYIVRHGDPDYSVDGLTPAGKEEAAALGIHFSKLLQRSPALGPGHEPTTGPLPAALRPHVHLYTSPLGRARDTAAATAAALGVEDAAVEEWTREMSACRLEKDRYNLFKAPGSALALWDCPGELLRVAGEAGGQERLDALVPEVAEHRPAYEALAASSDLFLLRHGLRREGTRYVRTGDYDEHAQVVVFCHLGFGLAWIAHLLHLPATAVYGSFYVAPSSVSTFVFDERGPESLTPRALGVGDVSHLAAAGLATVDSGYEVPGEELPRGPRPSGIKSTFW